MTTEKINNIPDVERYINFYKWFDSSVNRMLQQLIPASSYQLSGHGDTIERHVFERNKYWTKFPTLETKAPDIEGILLGINEMLYDYDCLHPQDHEDLNNNFLELEFHHRLCEKKYPQMHYPGR